MIDHYILDGKTPVKTDLMTWAKWLENGENRIVQQTTVGDKFVSTVFLGLDHQFGDGPPLIFETMIFAGEYGGDMWRCSTWEQAEQQHEAALAGLQES